MRPCCWCIGDGTFQPALNLDAGSLDVPLGVVAVSAGQGPESIAAADFNGDGFQDLVVTDVFSNNVWVLLGHGDGSFDSAVSYTTVSPGRSLAVGDFNRDGIPDLAVTQGQTGADRHHEAPGNGDGTFRPAISFVSGNWPHSMAVADFNGDGKPDLVTADITTDVGDDAVSVLINDTPDVAGLAGPALAFSGSQGFSGPTTAQISRQLRCLERSSCR